MLFQCWQDSYNRKRTRRDKTLAQEAGLDFSAKNLKGTIHEILKCRSSQHEVEASSKVPAMRLLKFIHGCMHSLAENNEKSLRHLRTAMPLDSHGIMGISASIQWIAHYISVLPRGYHLINSEMAKSSGTSPQQCVANLQCLQAFTELVQRTAHYKVFATGNHPCLNL